MVVPQKCGAAIQCVRVCVCGFFSTSNFTVPTDYGKKGLAA